MIRSALDLAYEKDQFLSGSSVLSCTVYEVQLWQYYLIYIKRSKTDRLEFTTFRTAQGAFVGKTKKAMKPESLIAQPKKPKKSASDMFKKMFKAVK